MKEMRVLPWIIFWTSFCLASTQGYRILGLFPFQGKSHFVMFENLMKGLAKKGHRVDVISQYPLKEPFVNYTDLIVIPQERNIVNNVSYEFVSKFVTTHGLSTIGGNNVCEHLAHPEIQKLIRNPPKDPPYDVVLIQVFL